MRIKLSSTTGKRSLLIWKLKTISLTSMRKNIPICYEPALYDYGMKGFAGTKTNKRYSTPELHSKTTGNSIMKVENLVQNTKPVEEILDYKMKNKSLKGITLKTISRNSIRTF